jgi:uncharacterized protein DUF3810
VVFAACAWALVVLLRALAGRHPALVERIYARGLYALVARAAAAATGWAPFSVAEAGAAVLLALVAGAFVWRVAARKRWQWRGLALLLARTAALAGIAVLAFDLLWGLNYDRETVAGRLGYDTGPVSVVELREAAADLLGRAAALRAGRPEDASGALRLADGARGAMRRAARGYDGPATRALALPALAAPPKLVALSPLMSYLGIAGIFIPFTGEANVNATLPDWELPFCAAHELAHQRGIAREDEANYVGYLACREHPDADFQYSGTFRAGLYVLGALASADRDAYSSLRAGLSPALRRDLGALAAWSRKYESRLADVQERVNDTYLKTQGQREGVRSYGRMVDLLIAERRGARVASPDGQGHEPAGQRR